MDDRKIKEMRAIQDRSLTDFISKELEESILSGKMLPGSRINESQLARELNISRAPIREACRKLEKFGFIQVLPNQGSFVRKIEVREVAELCDIRAALDALAGEKAAENFKKSDLKIFEPIINEMEALVQEGDSKGYFFSNLKFHLTIIDISGNRSLRNLYEGNYKKTALFRTSFMTSEAWIMKSFEQHKQILQALLDKATAKAASLMRHHILGTKEQILKEFKSLNRQRDNKQ